jgi:hypothetical protein
LIKIKEAPKKEFDRSKQQGLEQSQKTHTIHRTKCHSAYQNSRQSNQRQNQIDLIDGISELCIHPSIWFT